MLKNQEVHVKNILIEQIKKGAIPPYGGIEVKFEHGLISKFHWILGVEKKKLQINRS